MKNFYIERYEKITSDTPQLINGRRRYCWYHQIGREVNFSNLSFDRAAKFIKQGFAPAIPINHGIECGEDNGWKANYIYPVSFGDISDVPF